MKESHEVHSTALSTGLSSISSGVSHDSCALVDNEAKQGMEKGYESKKLHGFPRACETAFDEADGCNMSAVDKRI